MSDDTTPPVAPADDDIDVTISDPGARSQARVALVTAVVALVSAVLGPLVALQINSSQIDNQRDTSEAANRAEDARSKREFVRNERRTAYAAFLTAFNSTALDTSNAETAFATKGYDRSLASAKVDELNVAAKSVTAAYFQVNLVSPQETYDRAVELFKVFSQYTGNVVQLGTQLATTDLVLTDKQRQALIQEANESYGQLVGMSQEFTDQAKDDLE